ncbi:hypothetical protein ACQKOH_01085 [Sphingomonas sp. NPDC092331]|jgi:hypothetical protein|uniref:hypothetical protein n=1 Tax=unclassified Sphingomonas TaxID=196159 RepID=UPI0031F4BB80
MLALGAGLLLALAGSGQHGVVDGPGRFCGYGPVIDLRAGERIKLGQGGIHSGRFRWKGAFGSLDVTGIQWGSPPSGEGRKQPTAAGQTLFEAWREGGRHVVAIWNGSHGVAYFRSSRRFTPAQLAAIERVSLFDEAGPAPEGCKLRTVFVWE